MSTRGQPGADASGCCLRCPIIDMKINKDDLTFRHPRVGGDPEIMVSLWTPACAGVTTSFQNQGQTWSGTLYYMLVARDFSRSVPVSAAECRYGRRDCIFPKSFRTCNKTTFKIVLFLQRNTRNNGIDGKVKFRVFPSFRVFRVKKPTVKMFDFCALVKVILIRLLIFPQPSFL